MLRRSRSWALPARPPEEWLHPAWTPLLLTAVLLAVVVPGWLTETPTEGEPAARLALAVVACVAAALTAHGLLVEHVVRGFDRLRWLAVGFAVQTLLLLVRAAEPGTNDPRALTVTALATPAVFALGVAVARPVASIGLPLVALTGLLLFSERQPATGALLAAVTGLLAAVVWLRAARRTAMVAVTLLLLAAAAGLLAGDPEAMSQQWFAASALLTAGTVASGLPLGLRAALGYGQQSVRWHRLEREVREVRTGSPLMPSRSVIPDDDEGLPSQDEVQHLINAGVVRIALQPVVDLSSGLVVGHEALSRFGGRVPTDRWFKGASRYGLGGLLEQLTVRKALQSLATLPAGELLAINVSPAALHDDVVIGVLNRADLSRVLLEITEHEAVGDYAALRKILHRLRKAGARIAVDDTGAGFASLRHVLMLQPDVIKLDTSLTRGIDRDPKQQALVRAVTSFSAQVGAAVLAEGIEEQVQLDALKAIGVHYGQGWHLGVPAFPDATRA